MGDDTYYRDCGNRQLHAGIERDEITLNGHRWASSKLA